MSVAQPYRCQRTRAQGRAPGLPKVKGRNDPQSFKVQIQRSRFHTQYGVCVPFIINQTPAAGGDHCHGPWDRCAGRLRPMLLGAGLCGAGRARAAAGTAACAGPGRAVAGGVRWSVRGACAGGVGARPRRGSPRMLCLECSACACVCAWSCAVIRMLCLALHAHAYASKCSLVLLNKVETD